MKPMHENLQQTSLTIYECVQLITPTISNTVDKLTRKVILHDAMMRVSQSNIFSYTVRSVWRD